MTGPLRDRPATRPARSAMRQIAAVKAGKIEGFAVGIFIDIYNHNIFVEKSLNFG